MKLSFKSIREIKVFSEIKIFSEKFFASKSAPTPQKNVKTSSNIGQKQIYIKEDY